MSTTLAVSDHTQRAHSAVVGGSSAGRVLQCPGSVLLTQRFPNVESDFAAEGTALHMAMDMIMSGLTKDDTDVIGLTFNGYEITQDLYDEAVAPALKMWDEIDRELGGIEFLSEQRVQFPGIDDAFGTTDIVGSAKDRTVLVDFKFGRGVAVSAVDNPQGKYYGLAAMHTPATQRFFAPDKPVEIFIFQPRVMDGEPFTRWMTTPAQLEAFGVELRHAVQKGLEHNAEYVLGPYCRFCSAKTGCPAQLGQVRNASAMTRDELVAHLDELLPFADNFIAVGEAIKELAHGELERGSRIAGWKLVAKRPTRKWIDDKKVLKWLAKIGLPAADRYVKKLVSPAQAEAALKKAKLSAQLPDGFVVKESSGTTLAPESDPRPALTAAPGSLRALAEKLAAR